MFQLHTAQHSSRALVFVWCKRTRGSLCCVIILEPEDHKWWKWCHRLLSVLSSHQHFFILASNGCLLSNLRAKAVKISVENRVKVSALFWVLHYSHHCLLRETKYYYLCYYMSLGKSFSKLPSKILVQAWLNIGFISETLCPVKRKMLRMEEGPS